MDVGTQHPLLNIKVKVNVPANCIGMASLPSMCDDSAAELNQFCPRIESTH